MNLEAIVVEEDGILGIKSIPEVTFLKNRFELSQQF